ncbi:MAG: rRNA maturation RNase YbeY [Clostridia bacterium]|nr:rRNA maturation RNase YbeY [Clostridia bacterium]
MFFELEFVGKSKIKKLNKDFRQIDKVTDVLSFPSLDGVRYKTITKKDFPYDYDIEQDAVFIGSIVVCTKKAEEQAKEYGHSVEREVTFLICHGLLHLFGYDHINNADEIEMKKLQDEIMQKIGVLR